MTGALIIWGEIFQIAIDAGLKDLTEISVLKQFILMCIGSNWVTQFKENPEDACLALMLTHKQVYNDKNTADNMFQGFLQESIQKQLGKSVEEMIKQYVTNGYVK